MIMDYTKILLKPVVTEKATLLRENASQIAFFVDSKANKIEIGKAVEEAFKVKVESVNVVTVKPRERKRQGRVKGRIPGYRKAYVTLTPGEKIDFFEGV
jgi:large subunit ribosomal protein L23